MEEVEEGLILHFGKDKRVHLQKTSQEQQVVGEQGYLLGSLSNKWIFCIPPGALEYDQEVAVSFYHVTDTAGLDSNEFVTGIIEITPHQLAFSKPVELLLRHDLCIGDDSSKVTVLYHSGERDCETVTSLCQLSASATDKCATNDIKATLWDDFVHIKASHMCKFGLDCKGQSDTDVWASLFAPECPHPEHFLVRLSLASQEPRSDDKDAKKMQGYGLIRKSELRLNLECSVQEKLQINVKIPSNTEGWTVNEDSEVHKIIDYNDIKNMVLRGQSITDDFWFSKGKSPVDVTSFAPNFKFNRRSCRLNPPVSSAKPFIPSSGTVLECARINITTGASNL